MSRKRREVRREDGVRRRATPHHGMLCVVLALSLLRAAAALAGAPEPEPDDGRWGAAVDATPDRATRAAPSGLRPDRADLEPDPRGAPPLRPEPPAPAPASAERIPTRPSAPRKVLDPAARLLREDDASEAWTLFIELESGHRITQRFLLSNAGPGEHNAVAIGHLSEPGRAPFRYENGRRRPRWTLSEDRLFFDIAASHLDLHRPRGELRITKEDIEIRLFFDFAAQGPSSRVPAERLPPGYHVDVLALGAATQGSIKAPWMDRPLESKGRAWLVHTWTEKDESDLLSRRVEVFGRTRQTSFYGIQLAGRGDWQSAWALASDAEHGMIESRINVPGQWNQSAIRGTSSDYPLPGAFQIRDEPFSGQITLGQEWLRFDPLEVIPQPFRWFIRRSSQPQEVWADARIEVTLLVTPEIPPLPNAGETTSAKTVEGSRSRRETEDETAKRSVTGVASITFLNPTSRR